MGRTVAKKGAENSDSKIRLEKLKDSSFSNISVSSQSKRVYVRTRRRTVVLLVCLFVAPWLVLTYLFFSGKLRPSDAGKPSPTPDVMVGSWGRLEYDENVTAPPRDFLKSALFPLDDEVWLFKGMSRTDVEALLTSAKLEPQVFDMLMSKADNVLGQGWRIRPDDASIFSLSPTSRSAIYKSLAKFAENTRQYDPLLFDPVKLDQWLNASGLRAEIVTRLRGLLYPHDKVVLLADIVPLLRTISDETEKNRLLDVLLRRTSYLVRLRVDSSADIPALSNYWGFPNRQSEVEPLLRSLSQMKSGNATSIGTFLPGFAKQRLNTYPRESSDALSRRRDCHWTSMNFFNDAPDDRFANPELVRQALTEDYQAIENQELKIGDVAMLTTPDGRAVHSCVYIAGSFYFTKNGPSHISPWIIKRIDEIRDQFPGYEGLTVKHFRLKKNMAAGQ